jgi:hypothetical protein
VGNYIVLRVSKNSALVQRIKYQEKKLSNKSKNEGEKILGSWLGTQNNNYKNSNNSNCNTQIINYNFPNITSLGRENVPFTLSRTFS